MKKIKEMINNEYINRVLEKINTIRNDEKINYKLIKIKEKIIRMLFLFYYNWKKIIIGIFAFLTLAVNTNIENIIKKLTIPPFLQGFIDYINSIFNFITFNKFEINSIYIFIYVLEIIVWCGIIYILDKYFRLKNKHQKEFKKMRGFKNEQGEYPYVISQKRNKSNYKILDEIFYTNGIPPKEWKEKKENLEERFNKVILNDFEEIDGNKSKILVQTILPKYKVPKVIEWKDNFISPKNSVLVLGENLLGKITVDINKTPHILNGGTTGSGKSVLTESFIYQCYKKGYIIYIADLKMIDFMQWKGLENVNVITDIESVKTMLTKITDELVNRQILFERNKVRNIDEYNSKYADSKPLKRIVFVCDEIAEIFNGENKTTKDIEWYLSRIARLGRAFGITLILSTQRPDCKVLEGQIKSNLDVRICGRADRTLSEIILGKGNTDADALIPKEEQGLFLTNSNKIFRGYLFPKNFIQNFTDAEKEKQKEKRGVIDSEYTSNN